MKLALVHARSSWTGGTERYLAQLAAELVRRGHEVHVVCKTHRGEPVAGAHYRFLRAPALGGAWRLWAFARAVERHVDAEGYDLVVGLGKTWTHDVLRLGGGLHRTYLELAHVETLGPLEKLLRIDRPKHAVALAIEARALAPGAFRRVITNSEMVRRGVCARYGVRDEAVSVIYNGVDLTRFERARHASVELRRELELDEDGPIVLFLGTGYGRKGLALVLDAFPALLARHPHASLVVAGFDSAWMRYRERAKALGIDARARFLGGRSDPERLYALADVYVLPTRYDPFANTTLEALASGLPVITTTTNGASEILEPGLHGTILPHDAPPAALAAALLDWAPRERSRAARAPTRALAERFPAARTASLSAQLLEEVLHAREG